MIKIEVELAISDDNANYISKRKVYLFGVNIYTKNINSNLPIDVANCYPENMQPKIGFNKK